MKSQSTDAYTSVAVALHWLIAGLILFNLASGFVMEGLPPKQRGPILSLHFSLGMAVLVLSLARLVWRLTHAAPPLDPHLSVWERRTAHAVHALLYVMMLAMPVIGWSILSANKRSLLSQMHIFGGLVPLPPISPVAHLSQPLKQAMHDRFVDYHTIGGWILVVLLLGHVAGALKHQFVDRRPQFGRMWFSSP